MDNLAVIDESLGLTWLRIPKAASNSVHTLLELSGMSMVEHPLESARLYPDNFVAIFVRNPWDRLVSAYCDRVVRTVNCLRIERPPVGLHPGISFPDFVALICRQPDTESDQHWRSVSSLLVVEPDFVGRIESIELDWERLRIHLGWGAIDFGDDGFPHKKRTPREHYRKFYTPDLRDQVARRYAEDISRFGYEF